MILLTHHQNAIKYELLPSLAHKWRIIESIVNGWAITKYWLGFEVLFPDLWQASFCNTMLWSLTQVLLDRCEDWVGICAPWSRLHHSLRHLNSEDQRDVSYAGDAYSLYPCSNTLGYATVCASPLKHWKVCLVLKSPWGTVLNST